MWSEENKRRIWDERLHKKVINCRGDGVMCEFIVYLVSKFNQYSTISDKVMYVHTFIITFSSVILPIVGISMYNKDIKIKYDLSSGQGEIPDRR